MLVDHVDAMLWAREIMTNSLGLTNVARVQSLTISHDIIDDELWLLYIKHFNWNWQNT